MHHDAGAGDDSGEDYYESIFGEGAEDASRPKPSNRVSAADVARDFLEAGKPHEAAAVVEAVIRAGRGNTFSHLALIDARLAAGDAKGAVDAAREAVSLYPGSAATALGLGKALLAAGLVAGAIGEFQRALRIDPGNDDATFQLGCAWLAAGEAEKALASFADVPSRPELDAKIIEAEAMRAMRRSNPSYVRHLFDQFSADYDARMLGQLGYAAPLILRNLAGLVLPGAEGLVMLDLGCGTGLAAEAFRDMASVIDGIDLSPAMIEKARGRNIYRDLSIADLESALNEGACVYDLLVAADTLVYLGDLSATFCGAAHALKPGGTFLFTVESGEDADFVLGPKRRWAHSEAYLRGEAAKAGFAIAGFLAASPRSERGVPVPGFAVALRLGE